jgi:hypothetical protein
MRANRFDRAAIVLGAGAMASAVLVFTTGDPWGLARVRGATVALVLVVGALVIVAGWRGWPALMLAAGAVFLAAAALQLAQAGRDTNWLAGNGSTVALLLGLGIGLLVAGLARHKG